MRFAKHAVLNMEETGCYVERLPQAQEDLERRRAVTLKAMHFSNNNKRAIKLGVTQLAKKKKKVTKIMCGYVCMYTSWNHRMAEMGRDLWRFNPCLKQDIHSRAPMVKCKYSLMQMYVLLALQPRKASEML